MKPTVTSYRGRRVCKNLFLLLLLPLFPLPSIDRLLFVIVILAAAPIPEQNCEIHSLLIRTAERVVKFVIIDGKKESERERVSVKVRKEKSLMKNEVS